MRYQFLSRTFFDVDVLPVVGNNKGQRRWIVFIVVTVCAQQFRLQQCSGFCEFGVDGVIRVSPGQQNEFWPRETLCELFIVGG